MLESIIRTAVPYLVGLLVSLGVTLEFEVTTEVQSAVTQLLTFALGTVYYLAARTIETRWPKWGWLLGSPKQPVYGESDEER